MAREKRAARKSPKGVLFVVVGDAVIHGLDAWVALLNEKVAGPAWDRSVLVRRIVDRAMKEWGATGEAP